MPFVHPSGGLVYHLRAWRYGNTLWKDFHGRVRDWLAGWHPDHGHLVLVGPSGGYALDRDFLGGFGRITVLEPDLLARFLLRQRFPGISFRFDPDPGLARADGFNRLARRYTDGAILFCNLLGQTLVGQGLAHRRQEWLDGLAPALAGRAWASWHDLASTHEAPDGMGKVRLERAAALDLVMARYWSGGNRRVLAIHDHECAGLLPEVPREYAVWELRPGQYHVVEWLARG